MAQAPNTNSTLTLPNGTNKTSTAISTNIIILVNNTPVGAVQSLQVREERSIRMIDEVGTDGHVDSTPNQSTNITGSCQRIRFDRLRIAEAFSRGFVHAKSQVYPFDIVVLDKQKRDQTNQISTVIKNVWIQGIEYTYSATDWVIVETMNWQAETIFSVLNGGSSSIPGGVPVSVGGELGIKHIGSGPNGSGNLISGDGIVNVEQLADVGNRRGSLDAAGLIDLSSSSGELF
jgi:hypothetical protein